MNKEELLQQPSLLYFPCNYCHGEGYIDRGCQMHFGLMNPGRICPICDGSRNSKVIDWERMYQRDCQHLPATNAGETGQETKNQWYVIAAYKGDAKFYITDFFRHGLRYTTSNQREKAQHFNEATALNLVNNQPFQQFDKVEIEPLTPAPLDEHALQKEAEEYADGFLKKTGWTGNAFLHAAVQLVFEDLARKYLKSIK